MINFFRKIRQRLLTENKFNKYLIYALGEIALVVIGILIALQVNNWNENKKIEASQTLYLSALKLELEENQKKLQVTIKENENNLRLARNLSKLIGKDSSVVSPANFRNLLLSILTDEVQYRPNNGVITDINSGKLEIIKDDSLRFRITGWDGELKRVRFQEQDEVNIARQNLFKIVFEKCNFKNMVFEYHDNTFLLTESELKSYEYALLKSLQFENFLTHFIVTSDYLDYDYRQLYKIQGDFIEKISRIQNNE